MVSKFFLMTKGLWVGKKGISFVNVAKYIRTAVEDALVSVIDRDDLGSSYPGDGRVAVRLVIWITCLHGFPTFCSKLKLQ